MPRLSSDYKMVEKQVSEESESGNDTWQLKIHYLLTHINIPHIWHQQCYVRIAFCRFLFSLAPFAQPDDADMPTFAIG